jgi:hypothetical protein
MPVGWLLRRWRKTQRYEAIQRIGVDAATGSINTLAIEYGRYGHRRSTMLLRMAGGG